MTTDFATPNRGAIAAQTPAEITGYASVVSPAAAGGASRLHTGAYVGLWFFSALLIFRPAETIPGLAGIARLSFGVAALTMLFFFSTQIWHEGRLTARPREVNILLALCVAALISIPFGIDPWTSRHMFLDAFVKFVLMFLVMINAVRTEKRLRGMLYLVIAAGAFLAYSALSAYRRGAFSVEGYRVRGTFTGTLADPNDTALFLVMMIPLAIALFLAARAKFPRLILVLATLLMTGAIFVTYSRGGFLALLVMSAFLTWKLSRRAPIQTAIFAFFALILVAVALPPNYLERLSSITDSSRDTRGSASQRRDLLNQSVEVALTHPLAGIGMGNFPQVSRSGHASHNAYTQVASEMGLPALALYLAFIFVALGRLKRIERETRALAGNHDAYKRIYFLSIGLQASLIGFMVGSFFLSVAYYWFLYYLVGFAVCLSRLYETGPGRVVGSFEMASDHRLQ